MEGASAIDWIAGTGIILSFGFEHGCQESKALWLLIQRPSLLEICLRLLEGAERHAAVHVCQLMGKGDEWGGITVPGQGLEHREVVVAKRRWDYQPRLAGSFKFRVHTQTGNTTVAIIEGMHLRDQKKDIEGTGRSGRQFPAGWPAAGSQPQLHARTTT
jgi:hypothetical protein